MFIGEIKKKWQQKLSGGTSQVPLHDGPLEMRRVFIDDVNIFQTAKNVEQHVVQSDVRKNAVATSNFH